MIFSFNAKLKCETWNLWPTGTGTQTPAHTHTKTHFLFKLGSQNACWFLASENVSEVLLYFLCFLFKKKKAPSYCKQNLKQLPKGVRTPYAKYNSINVALLRYVCWQFTRFSPSNLQLFKITLDLYQNTRVHKLTIMLQTALCNVFTVFTVPVLRYHTYIDFSFDL